MCVDADGKKRVEKWVLRKAFDLPGARAYLPQDVLWRQKEQFSDGVGYSWIDGLREHAAKVVTDADMLTAPIRFPFNTPTTKEAAYFRTIFHSHFPNNPYGNGIESTVPGGPSVACSTAKAIEWDASWSDPAGPVGPLRGHTRLRRVTDGCVSHGRANTRR